MIPFVILRHTLPAHADRPSHWDLMLATDESGPLWTWELLEEPVMGQSQWARRLPDHRREYLFYEGPVSNDRGAVQRWEQGELVWCQRSDMSMAAELHGVVLVARVHLSRDSDTRWLVRWEPVDDLGVRVSG